SRLFCFFFQAEDGIRDFHVTGVQTCALPISSLALMLSAAFRSSTLSVGLSVFLFFAGAFLTEMLKAWGGGSWGKYLLFANLDLRSEERRVGIECRSRGLLRHLSQNVCRTEYR